jgi:hypothetical protein
MLIALAATSLLVALVAYEVRRQRRITRRLESLARMGLSHRQLIARGLI